MMQLIGPVWQKAFMLLEDSNVEYYYKTPLVSVRKRKGTRFLVQCYNDVHRKYFLLHTLGNFTVWNFCTNHTEKATNLNILLQSNELASDLTQLLFMLEEYSKFKITLVSMQVENYKARLAIHV